MLKWGPSYFVDTGSLVSYEIEDPGHLFSIKIGMRDGVGSRVKLMGNRYRVWVGFG